jgi:hypothetical protein
MPCIIPAAYFAVNLTSAEAITPQWHFSPHLSLTREAPSAPEPDEHPLQNAPSGFTTSSDAFNAVMFNRMIDGEYKIPSPAQPGMVDFLPLARIRFPLT